MARYSCSSAGEKPVTTVPVTTTDASLHASRASWLCGNSFRYWRTWARQEATVRGSASSSSKTSPPSRCRGRRHGPPVLLVRPRDFSTDIARTWS